MAEYIEREALMNEIHRIGGHNLCGWDTIGVKALVDRQPTADVVEVVRKGVKDFAKYLIDKAQNGAVSVLDIVDCAKEWSDNYKNM